MKAHYKIILLVLVVLVLTTCKKISKHSVDMSGLWTCNHNECNWMKLEIKKSGEGDYGPMKTCKGELAHLRGRARFTDEALYIGTAKFEFVNKPEASEPSDSVGLSFTKRKVHFLAKMTIRESKLRGGQTYTFFKIEDF